MKDSTIIDLEEKLRQAMYTSDVGILDELIADSLVFTAPNGVIVNKQMDLEAHRSGVQKLTKLDSSALHVQLHDNFAIVTVKMQIEGSYGSISIDGNYSYTRVWAKQQRGWQVVAGHVSQLLSSL